MVSTTENGLYIIGDTVVIQYETCNTANDVEKNVKFYTANKKTALVLVTLGRLLVAYSRIPWGKLKPYTIGKKPVLTLLLHHCVATST